MLYLTYEGAGAGCWATAGGGGGGGEGGDEESSDGSRPSG